MKEASKKSRDRPAGPEHPAPASPVLQSIVPVVRESRWVSLDEEAIATAVDRWGHGIASAPRWDHPCHYADGTAETVRWIFLLDVLNYSFWPDPGRPAWTVRYQGEAFSGYWALAASLKRAMDSGVPITRADYLAQMPEADLRDVFAGEGTIPLFETRLEHVREAGRRLLERWAGDAANLVHAAGGTASRLLRLVIRDFPSFRDEADYRGHRVLFWKRAQIFVSDLYQAFQGKHWGRFRDVAHLTAFADYKLPQVLRELGILRYDPGLAERIDRRERLSPGSPEEVEIRAMTIWAVESIRNHCLRLGRPVKSADVDHWLWHLGQLEPFRKRPYHLCRTIYY